MELNYQMLGQRIYWERRARKLTQEQLAERANISPAFLGHIERGGRRMSMDTFYRISLALGCSSDKLLGLELNGVDCYAAARELLALAQALASMESGE